MSVDEKPIKIKVEKVSKIFGKQTKKAVQMLANGKTKKEILKATGYPVAFRISFFVFPLASI